MLKRFQCIVLLSFLLMTSINASQSYWEGESIRAYVHNSELQRRWAIAFLAPHLKNLLGNEHILDIGCGDGKITADLSTFVPNGTVIGIDPSKDMISWALMQYDSREYPNLSFRMGDFLNPRIQSSYDLVVSLCAMHHCPDHRHALKTIHTLLKPTGKLLILVPSAKDFAWSDAVAATCQNPKWSAYWEDYVPRIFLNSDQYNQLLNETHFEVLSIEDIPTIDPFVNKQELIAWLIGTYPSCVPKNLANEFYSEIIDNYLYRDPNAINDKGAISVSFDSIRIIATAKQDSR